MYQPVGRDGALGLSGGQECGGYQAADRHGLVGAVGRWARRLGCGCGVPGLLGGDAPGQGLMGALVLALGGGVVGLGGDRLDPQGAHVLRRPPVLAASGGVQGGAVVGQQPLGHPVRGHALVEHLDRRLAGLGVGGQGGHRQARVVVDELEDDGLAPTGQHVLGGVHLPAGVGSGVDEPPPRRARPLPGLGPGHVLAAEDTRQRRRRGRLKVHPRHLAVHAHGPVVQARGLQRRPDLQGLAAHLVTDTGRTAGRPGRARLEGRRLALRAGPGPYRVERLTVDALLTAERGHRAPGRVIRPPHDRQTNTRTKSKVYCTRPPKPTRSVTWGGWRFSDRGDFRLSSDSIGWSHVKGEVLGRVQGAGCA